MCEAQVVLVCLVSTGVNVPRNAEQDSAQRKRLELEDIRVN